MAELILNIDIKNAKDLDRLKTNLKEVGVVSQTTQRNISKSSESFASLTTKAVGLTAALYGIKEGLETFVGIADSMTNINSKLTLVTKTTQDLRNAQESLFAISQSTRSELESTVDLYTSMARSTKELNITQGELLDITETVNKAMIISGGSAESMNAALIQLGQGLASGTLRGEELNSVMEQTPRLAQAIADGMGITVGQLRKLGSEGKITSTELLRALKSQSETVSSEFSRMAVTVDQALTVFGNSAKKAVGDFDREFAINKSLSESIVEFSKYLDSNISSIMLFAKRVKDVATLVANGYLTVLQTSQLGYLEIIGFFTDKSQSVLQNLLDVVNEIDEIYVQINNKMGGDAQLSNFSIVEDGAKSVQEQIDALKLSIQQMGEESDKAFDRLITGNYVIEIKKSVSSATNEVEALKTTMSTLDKILAQEVDIGKILDAQIPKTITSAIQDGFDGNFDLTSITSQFSEAIGSAVTQASISGALSGSGITAAAQANPLLGLGIGIGAMAIGSMLAKESKTAEQIKSEHFAKIDEQTKSITDALDAQTKILTNFGNSVEALQSQFTVSQQTFAGEVAKLEISKLHGGSWVEKVAAEEISKQYSKQVGGTGDFAKDTLLQQYQAAKIASTTRGDAISFDEQDLANFETAARTYISELLSTKDVYLDLSNSLKDVYDSVNDNFYANKKLADAQEEVSNLLNGRDFSSYLQDTITGLDSFGASVESMKNDLISAEIETQIKALSDLETITGQTFDNSASKALDYLNSIELVGNAMAEITKEAKDLQKTIFDTIASENEKRAATLLTLDASNRIYQEFLYAIEDETKVKEEALGKQKESLDKYVSEVTKSIATLESAFSSMTSVIDTLRGNAIGAEYTMGKFRDAMAKAKELSKGTDYEGFKDALDKAIGYSSVLNDSENFALTRDQKFAQLVAAQQFEDMQATTLDQIDYLKMIEENTRGTLLGIEQAITGLGQNVSTSMKQVIDQVVANNPSYTGIAETAKAQALQGSNFEENIYSAYQSTLGRTPQGNEDAYWLARTDLQNANISTIQTAIARGASSAKDVENAVEWLANNTSSTFGQTLAAKSADNGTISKDTFLDMLYEYGLNRQADEGKNWWLSQNMTAQQILGGFARGAEVAGETYHPFANGGIVTKPTYGLIGEAGYPEIMTNSGVIPLKNPNDPLNSSAIVAQLMEQNKNQAIQIQLLNAIIAKLQDQTDIQNGTLGYIEEMAEGA